MSLIEEFLDRKVDVTGYRILNNGEIVTPISPKAYKTTLELGKDIKKLRKLAQEYTEIANDLSDLLDSSNQDLKEEMEEKNIKL